MKTVLQKILNLKGFFNILQSDENVVKLCLEIHSKILLQNIHSHWLQYILSKTRKSFTVYLNNTDQLKKQKGIIIPFGYINEANPGDTQRTYELDWNSCIPQETCELKFNLIVPKQDTMQYFIQWQRYRKFWWSSISSTPSLFSIDETKHGEDTSDAIIVAKFPSGCETVETLNISSKNPIIPNTSHLCCTMPLENALFILLLDGLISSTKDGYLRLHRVMAPYKLSFALDKGVKSEDTLKDLANLLHWRLARNKISTWLPDFTLSAESQLQENLNMGVAYTVVLSDRTLSDGIFHLLNSSTMLKEQIHIADFDSYATLIFGK